MSNARDDEALSWAGDDDPTLDGGTPASAPALPDGFTPLGRGSDDVGHIESDGTITPAGERGPLSNAVLVTLGVLGGVYALYVIGWIIGGLRLQDTANFLVSPVGYTAAFWLAIAAPLLWFITAFVLTRSAKAWVRIAALVAGLALLIPWPFILVGAVGAVS